MSFGLSSKPSFGRPLGAKIQRRVELASFGHFERELARRTVVDHDVEPRRVDVVIVGDLALGREDGVGSDGRADAAQGRGDDGRLIVDAGDEQPDRRIADRHRPCRAA